MRSLRKTFVWASLIAMCALLLTPPVMADWVSEITAANPLHWFRFEETSGATADDQGSADANGTYVGGVTLATPGLVGNAASFDGAGHVLIGGPNLATDWTLEAIFSADIENGGVSQGLIGADFASADARTAIKAEQWNETGQLGYTAFGVVDVTFTDAAAATPADFTHVVMVGDSAGVTLYVNGASAGTGATSAVLSRHAIGTGAVRADGTLVDGLTGAIDELVIYDRALDAAEIGAHYASIPEPSSWVLLVFGFAALIRRRRR